MIKNNLLLFSALAALLYWGFFNMLSLLFSGISGTFDRLVIMMGGNFAGLIQAICFGIFFYCIIELLDMRKSLTKQFEGFDFKILPNEESIVISPQDVNKIKLDIVYLEKQGVQNEINEFVKKACTQYRNENSISETMQVLENLISNKKGMRESALENIRFGVHANMSMGFIGTLIGLSAAIGKSYLAKTEEGIQELTGYLYTAFDTTLIALIFAVIINYLYHQYIKDIDSFYARTNTYIVDNLISKIYNK